MAIRGVLLSLVSIALAATIWLVMSASPGAEPATVPPSAATTGCVSTSASGSPGSDWTLHCPPVVIS